MPPCQVALLRNDPRCSTILFQVPGVAELPVYHGRTELSALMLLVHADVWNPAFAASKLT